ncbi:AraC family transcriptional regulator [Chitinophaga sancti]|uniref:helix-turn-helix transcriptional regulator n=1 Tax=Chitinophaga sancti TaxID=1004 RepID=UPI003F79923B
MIKSDFALAIIEYSADHTPMHRHDCFEIIYILEGRGIHLINDSQFPYGRGDLFLLTPADKHAFLAHSKSSFVIIDFTAALFGRNSPIGHDKPELSDYFRQLEYIFQHAGHFKGFIGLDEEDRKFSGSLVQRMVIEWEQNGTFREVVLQNLVFLLLNIIARYAQQPVISEIPTQVESAGYEMTQFIQHNIYDHQKISLNGIAEHFNLSKDYIGAYFNKKTGKTIRQFILDYKLELAKSRLRYSRMSISQIAEELGFTDESHLNKLFKRQEGLTAGQFRKTGFSLKIPS